MHTSYANRAEDDEFVSDSYQASTSDMAEADETMKKLGVGSTTESNGEILRLERERKMDSCSF